MSKLAFIKYTKIIKLIKSIRENSDLILMKTSLKTLVTKIFLLENVFIKYPVYVFPSHNFYQTLLLSQQATSLPLFFSF